jgi:hypothetical protein
VGFRLADSASASTSIAVNGFKACKDQSAGKKKVSQNKMNREKQERK